MNNKIVRAIDICKERDKTHFGKPSTVVILIVEASSGLNKVLVLRRPKQMRDYPGDWCFPGGRREKEDITLVETAWRELKEETSIPQTACHALLPMKDFYSGKGDLVRPYLVRIDESEFEKYFKACTDEVADCAFIELNQLDQIVEGAPSGKTSTRSPSYYISFTYNNERQNVWGLTASILVHLNNMRNGLAKPVDYGERYLKRKEACHDDN